MEKTSAMENTGTNNNLYMPYSYTIDDFTKKNLLGPIGSSRQQVLDEKLSSSQMQPGDILRYIPNLHHVPHLSTSGNQVPHHSKEIQSYFLDTNYQAISASSIHNRPQPPKIALFNGNPSLPESVSSLYPQYSHTYHDGKYHTGTTPLGHNHMVVTSRTSAPMSPILESYHQRVKPSTTEFKRNLPVSSSQQKKWNQSNSKSSRILNKEIPVNTPSEYATSAKDQPVFVNPSISTGYTATHAYNYIDKSWKTSYSKSDSVNYRQNASQSSSSYKALRLPAFQNTTTNEPSLPSKVSMPSTGSEHSLTPRAFTTTSSLNGCTSDAGDANTVHASLTQANSISTLTAQSKVITSTSYNRHKLACDLMKKSSCQTQAFNSEKNSSAMRGDDGKNPCQLRKKSRRRTSSCDSASPKPQGNIKCRRHSFSGSISTTLHCMPTSLKDKKKYHVRPNACTESAPVAANTGVSARPHLLKTESSMPAMPAPQHKAMISTIACDRPDRIDPVGTMPSDSCKQLPTDSLQGLAGNPSIVDGSKAKPERPPCNCNAADSSDAPYYTHLGAAQNVAGIRKLFEKRMGYCGKAIRIEKIIYTGKEGRTSQGCPMAKTVIRRSGPDEKVLVVCRHRPGHYCPTATIVVIILIWDGVARPLADFAYYNIAKFVPKHGEPTERRCATNEERTCACQGFDESTCGASFSFGCSWSMYYNGCKYARSHSPNKYKLVGTKDPEAEKFVGKICETLATAMSPLYEMAAPDAFNNQVEHEEEGYECRLGEEKKKKSRPFSGVTSCLDFCAHAHKDQHNMDNGSTVVLTFTKPELRHIGGKNADEQLHVLPLCKLDLTNEEGTLEGIHEKVSSGSIEILDRYHHQVRLRSTPKLSKKQKSRAKKKENGAADSPSYKRKGRPPKRSTSYENLFQTNKYVKSQDSGDHFTFHTPRYSQEFHVTSPVQLHSPAPPGINNQRAMTEQHRYLPVTSQTSHPGSTTQNQYNAAGRCTPNDNLPSIKGFFVGPEQNFHQQNTANFTNFHVNPDGQIPSTPPHIPAIKNMAPSPLGAMVSQAGANSPNAMKSFAGMMHNNVSADSEGYSTPSTPQSAYGDTMYSMPYGNTPANVSQGAAVPEEMIQYSDSEDNFLDSGIGGVAVAPGHGSVLIECAKKELHATTALRSPNRFYPSRISLVFYQHKSMNCRNHGAAEYEAKEEERKKQREKKMENSQSMVDASVQNSPMVPLGMQPYNVMNTVMRQYAGIASSGYHDQALKIAEERSSLLRQHILPNQGNMSQQMNPMSWVQPMQFGCNGRFVQNSPMSNSTYLNQPTLIPMPNSPQYPSQHSPAVPGLIGMDNRCSQPIPGANPLPVNSCTSHINAAARAQAPLLSSTSVVNSHPSHHSPSIRLPFTSNDVPSQMLFRNNSSSSHAGTPQSMRYMENPNVGYNGRSTM